MEDNKKSNNNDNLDFKTLSTILTDDELKEKKLKEINSKENNKKSLIYDININSIDDIILILLRNKYDYVSIEPSENYAKIIFKKDDLIKETRFIKYPLYTNILIKGKKIGNLEIDISDIEQKGQGVHNIKGHDIIVLSKTKINSFGECIMLKAKIPELKSKKVKVRKKVSPGTIFAFIFAILFIILVFVGIFIGFVIYNANTSKDFQSIKFFIDLGININNINYFLKKISIFIFSVILIILAIGLTISLFKTLLTKKVYKRKKIALLIASIFFGCLLFSTAIAWVKINTMINNLPRWEEWVLGDVQIFDNEIIKNGFDKEAARINETQMLSLIGPVEIKFDATNLKEREESNLFTVRKYIWNLGNGDRKETATPELIYTYEKSGNYNVSVSVEGLNKKLSPPKTESKDSQKTYTINIGHIVELNKRFTTNGGVIVSFNASQLKELGQISWYLNGDYSKLESNSYNYSPNQIFTKKTIFTLRLDNSDGENGKPIEKNFIIDGKDNNLGGSIEYEVSPDNDKNYTFYIKDLKLNNDEGFIEKYTWKIDNQNKNLSLNTSAEDLANIEKSSRINHVFSTYGNKNISVELITTNGVKKQLQKTITLNKKLQLNGKIKFFGDNNEEVKNVRIEKGSNNYILKDLGTPINIKFDLSDISLNDNINYQIEDIKWDFDGKGTFSDNGRVVTKDFSTPGNKKILINFIIKNKLDENIKEKIEQIIYIDFIKRNYEIDFKILADDEYAPTDVKFDASSSRVEDDDIISYKFDYGDGSDIDERDSSINIAHRYIAPGEYTVKLEIKTKKGDTYPIVEKKFVLKNRPEKANITLSRRTTEVFKEINFSAVGSDGQVEEYNWDFGDGETSSQPNPSHAYKTAGKYKVKLTIEFKSGNKLSAEEEVEIINTN